MMSEVFEFEYNALQEMLIVNHQEGFSYNMCYEDDVYSVTNKLNEQQATINKLKEENMDLRAKQTQMIIIMKDVVKDLKRIDTYRYAEHLEKIANLRFLSEKELEDE